MSPHTSAPMLAGSTWTAATVQPFNQLDISGSRYLRQVTWNKTHADACEHQISI